MTGDRLAGFVIRAIDALPDPLSLAPSELTDELRACHRELDGASYDDVYQNVMAWFLSQDAA